MAKEPSAEVRAKLEQATKARAAESQQEQPPVAPPVLRQASAVKAHAADTAPAAAGNAAAQYLLVDHFVGGSTGTFWVYAGGNWHGANSAQPADEQGVAQVAFASNQVEAYWGNSDELDLVRCWKYL